MRTIRTRGALGVAALVCALWAPAVASAAEKPVATTGGVANVTPTTVVLNATVNPKGAATTYFFQYGTTVLYGARTAEPAAGAGTKGVNVVADVGGLAPATTLPLPARRAERFGPHARQATARSRPSAQPLGLTLAATPNPVPSAADDARGRAHGHRQRQPPGAAPVQPVAVHAGVRDDGERPGHRMRRAAQFAFPVLGVPVNTQYRVLMASRPEVVSPVVVVGAAVKVTRRVRVTRGLRSARIRFRGRLTPAVDGQQVLIQRLRKGIWVTRAQTAARHAGAGFSRYSKSIRVRRGGRFRVVLNDASGKYTPSASRSRRVRRVLG